MRRVAAVVLLAMVLVGTAFAAGQVEQKTAAGSTATGFQKTGYPLVGEKMTFTVMHMKNAGTRPPVEMKHYQELEQKTNVRIEWISVPNTDGTRRRI